MVATPKKPQPAKPTTQAKPSGASQPQPRPADLVPDDDRFYPSADGEPLAETSLHADAIINTVVTLRHYLAGQRVIVLADQFLYYAKGFPRLRVAPDAMVIFEVEPGPRDNYKTWRESGPPRVIFEMTSQGTQSKDKDEKKALYENLGVKEYWLFDPKGEWIPEQLRGYRLEGDEADEEAWEYASIEDGLSHALGLRLAVDGALIAFYEQASGQRLPTPDDLLTSLKTEMDARQAAEARAEQAEQAVLQAQQQAEQAQQQAEQAQQQAEQAQQQAEQAQQQAEQERQRAVQAEQEIEQLKAQLKALGD